METKKSDSMHTDENLNAREEENKSRRKLTDKEVEYVTGGITMVTSCPVCEYKILYEPEDCPFPCPRCGATISG